MEKKFKIEHESLTEVIRNLLNEGYELGDVLTPPKGEGGRIGVYKKDAKKFGVDGVRYCGEIYHYSGNWHICIEPHNGGVGIEEEMFKIIRHYLDAEHYTRC